MSQGNLHPLLETYCRERRRRWKEGLEEEGLEERSARIVLETLLSVEFSRAGTEQIRNVFVDKIALPPKANGIIVLHVITLPDGGEAQEVSAPHREILRGILPSLREKLGVSIDLAYALPRPLR